MEAFLFILAMVMLGAYCMAAVEFNSIAHQKGYTGNKYGWWCFWFPFAGYLMVVALPDRSAQPAPQKPAYDSDALPEL